MLPLKGMGSDLGCEFEGLYLVAAHLILIDIPSGSPHRPAELSVYKRRPDDGSPPRADVSRGSRNGRFRDALTAIRASHMGRCRNDRAGWLRDGLLWDGKAGKRTSHVVPLTTRVGRAVR
jgi:hypothetical protein